MIVRITILISLIISLVACANANPKNKVETPRIQPSINISPTEIIIPTVTFTPIIIEKTKFIEPTNTSLPSLTPNIPGLSEDIEIAYKKDNRLWLWRRRTTTDLGLIPYAKMLWMSDDGAYIAFNSELNLEELGFFDFWVTDIEGNRKLMLNASTLKTMASPGLGLEWPDIEIYWIPGTHNILINDCDKGRLYSLDAETSKYSQFQQFSKPGYVHISPDGKTILFITFDELFAIDIKTNHLTKILKFDRIPSVTGNPHYLSPIWMNGSTKFRIAIPLTDIGTIEPKTEIIEVDLQKNVVIKLQEIATPYTLLHLSPKGSWAIYGERMVTGGDKPINLHLLNLKDGTDQLISSGEISILNWSPDEQRVMLRYQDKWIDRILTVGPKPAFLELAANTHFVTWLDSDRYFTASGEIRSVTKEGFFPLIDRFQGNPFDFIVH